MSRYLIASFFLAAAFISGCGQKGPLFLPEEAVVISEAPSTTSSAESTVESEATPGSLSDQAEATMPVPDTIE